VAFFIYVINTLGNSNEPIKEERPAAHFENAADPELPLSVAQPYNGWRDVLYQILFEISFQYSQEDVRQAKLLECGRQQVCATLCGHPHPGERRACKAYVMNVADMMVTN
jgi:hypothetical protein